MFHISPLAVADTWGLLDLDEERERLGSAVVDYAVGEIVENLRAREQFGSLTAEQHIFALIEAGRFPEYHYSNWSLFNAFVRLGATCIRASDLTVCASPTKPTQRIIACGFGLGEAGKIA